VQGGALPGHDLLVIIETIAPQLTRPLRTERGPQTLDPFLPVARLGRDVEVVDATMPCPRLADLFAAELVSSVAVVDTSVPERIGIVSRERFHLVSAGTLGYGRALLARRPVGDITDWSPLCVAPRTPLVDVVRVAMGRPVRHRLDDVLIAGHVWGVVSTTELVRTLAEITIAGTVPVVHTEG